MLRELLRVAFVGTLVTALVSQRRSAVKTLRIVVPNEWTLVQLCRATAQIARSGPPPERVELDLSSLAHIEDTTVAVLEAACLYWCKAGATVSIGGCQRDLRRAIASRGANQLASMLCPRPVPPAGALQVRVARPDH
jgi:hypothetical protein